MWYSRLLAMAAVAAGLVLSSATAKAGDPYWDRRDLRHDYARADRLRDDIARDRWRREEDLRRGRVRAAERQTRDIARDERALRNQMRDIRRDRRDLRHDYRGW